MKNTILLVAGIAVAVILSLLAFLRPIPAPTLGATPGTDNTNTCMSNAGVTTCHYRSAFNTATTTGPLCSFPIGRDFPASSTLRFAAIRSTYGSSTALTYRMFKAGTQYATTTAIGASSTGTTPLVVIASSTPGDPAYNFNTSDWFNVGGSGGTAPLALTGFCEAIFSSI
jgi:hypothetical protein